MRLKTIILMMLLPVLALAYVVPPPPIAVDSTSAGGFSGQFSDTASWTHTINTSGNSYLLVCITRDSAAPGSFTISSATDGSTNLTYLGKQAGNGTTNSDVYLYGLANPPSGANSISVTGSVNHIDGGSIAYQNVNTIKKVTGEAPSTSPATFTLGTDRSGSWLGFCGYNHGETYSGPNLEEAGLPAVFDSGGPFIPQSTTAAIGSFSWTTTAIVGVAYEIQSLKKIYVISDAAEDLLEWGFSTDIGSCDYDVSAWDTTTSPFTNITGSITSNTCNATNHNVTIGFGSARTGRMVLVPNPNKCGTGAC